MRQSASSPEKRAGASWPQWANVVLGLWLATSPLAFDYQSDSVTTNALVCGSLLVILSLLKAKWAVATLGVWLMFAPLVFWSPTAVGYEGATLIGALAIAFSILIPGEPERNGATTPPGWSYNPSNYAQRAPIIAFAFLSYFVARHLAAYQLGYIDAPWDPFFVEGTRNVLDSEVSKAFPVSDAGLGAVSYLVEALSGFVGGEKRWRTMPWMVVLFGILIVPLGVVSITLVVLQPVAVGFWCTLCLVTAVLMLLMISPAVDEVVATGQVLKRARQHGKPFWRSFFKGVDEENLDEPKATTNNLSQIIGFTAAPWNLVLASLLGVWLMAAPTVLAISGANADSSYVVGPLVTTFAVIAMAEVSRTARWLLVPMGLWIAASQWLVTDTPNWLLALTGVLIAALAVPKGKIKESYGGWERYIR
jgi:hypothetical protein